MHQRWCAKLWRPASRWITLNGEAKAIIQDIREYEKDQESLALLKILALSRKSINDGQYSPVAEAFASIRERVREMDGP